ncbi:MAG: VWA domain-containing protein, partial [Nitrospirae bacterium]|nr:VWA domain-containing protein [Nitrospirota bacterium]
TLIIMLFSGACKQGNLQKAKEMLAEDEGRPEIQVSVLFDNSISYKDYVEKTLDNVKKVFQYLASKYGNDENVKVSLILIDTEAKIVFNGKTRDLQRAYDDVANELRSGQTQFTDLTNAVNRALYFLSEGKAKRKVIMMFTDMKASKPDYHPKDEKTVPPPPDFPWDELKAENVEIYAFFVPYEERKLWKPVTEEKGVRIIAKLPEEMKTESAYNLVFKEEE